MKHIIKAVNLLVPKKCQLPILENVFLDNTYVRFTNLDIHCAIPYQSGVKCLVPAKPFVKLLTDFQDPKWSLDVVPPPKGNGETKVACRSGNESVKLSMYGPIADFPVPPDTRKKEFQAMLLEKDLERLKTASYFVSEDELRPAMMNILWHQDIVSTDGHRLFFDKALKSTKKPLLVNPLVVKLMNCFDTQAWSVSLVTKIEKAKTEEGLDSAYYYLVFESKERYQVIQQMSEEKFPNWKSVIPKENDKLLSVERKALLTANNRAMEYSSSTTHQVRITAGKNVRVSAEDIDCGKEYSQTIDGKLQGKPIEIGVRGDYLRSILEKVTSDSVDIAMSAPTRAAIIDERFLIMPVRLNQ